MTYDGKPSVKRKRANRNQARRIMTKAGVVRKGDGKEVHHRNGNTRDNRRRNLIAVPASKNRSRRI